MGIERRQHIRIAGPFDGFRVGLLDSPVTLYDLSEGGCFVNVVTAIAEPGRHIVLKINVPEEGWIFLKARALYTKPEFGFAVTFVDNPPEAAERLRRGLLRLQGKWSEGPPADEVEVGPETRIADSSAQAARTQQILIADDDGGVLTLLTKALSDYGLLAGRNIAEAWALGRGAPLDLLITDYLMPDGTGEELIERLREGHPSLKVLIMTGHGVILDREQYPWWTHERHLSKPFTVAALREAVEALIGPPPVAGTIDPPGVSGARES